MNMNKTLCFVALGFALVSSACCHADGIKIQLFRGAESVETLNFPDDKVKVSAKSFDFDSETNSWNLSGEVAITIGQNIPIRYITPPTRVVGDRANLVADNIEWQILSNDPIDIRNVPISNLSGQLKKHPKISLVRLNWYYTMGGYWQGNIALYDRVNHTLKEHQLISDQSAGTGGIYDYFYTNVTDEVLEKAAKSEGHPGPFSFDLLKDYGATPKDRR